MADHGGPGIEARQEAQRQAALTRIRAAADRGIQGRGVAGTRSLLVTLGLDTWLARMRGDVSHKERRAERTIRRGLTGLALLFLLWLGSEVLIDVLTASPPP